MKGTACFCISVTTLISFALPAWAGSEGTNSTFYGTGAGANNSSDLNDNTFLGASAGNLTTGGTNNTFVGKTAGKTNTTGIENTFVGTATGFSAAASYNTFIGSLVGSANTTGNRNAMLGTFAGVFNATGSRNTYVGMNAGHDATSGDFNTALGFEAGFNNLVGSRNVFLGYQAGREETGSSRLYIDNCVLNVLPCTSPFIYGEFDNHLLNINGVTGVSANNVAKSQMHFSLDNGDYGGFLTSVLPNNFFVSSGARYDSGNWVQRSADGNAVMAGSGGQGYRIFTHTGASVGSTFTNLALRLQIDYSGQFGINTAPVAGDEIHTSSGAHLTSGGVWTDASSREYKEHIRPLTTEEAQQTLAALDPVRYNYKANPREKHVGFIAEDVPELVAREDRKSLSPMDIVAVLTKVVQEKSQLVDEQRRMLETLAALVAQHEIELKRLRQQAAQ